MAWNAGASAFPYARAATAKVKRFDRDLILESLVPVVEGRLPIIVHANQARDIRAAPEEARALEGIGNSHLREGNPAQADAYLRQALTISRRIGAPGAQRIEETLRDPEWPEGTE